MPIRRSSRVLWIIPFVLIIGSNPCALAHTDVTVEQARNLIESTNELIVVDVREPYEYCGAGGHIPGALNYPLSSGVLEARYEELPIDGPILVVCRSGGRSNAAATFLDSKGFSMVYDMLRGMSAWQWETAPCKYSGGSGTAPDPYQIATAEDLIALGETPEDYDKHFFLTADIDLDPNLPNRKVFNKAIIAPDANDLKWSHQGDSFTGFFDGNSHTISNLTIVGGTHLGLFGRMTLGAEVRDLGVMHVNIVGSGDCVGGIAGSNSGVVVDCYSSGTLSGYYAVGGLVGHNDEDGNLITSFSAGTIIGSDCIGGLVGLNAGYRSVVPPESLALPRPDIWAPAVVANCYSMSSVSGIRRVGGAVGLNGIGGYGRHDLGIVLNCYSIGTVLGNESVGGLVGDNEAGTVHDSFWDVATTGQATSAGGTGKTTSEMQTATTFLEAGWDFVGEIENGVHERWQMPDEGGYPVLAKLNGYTPERLLGQGTSDDPYLISNAMELGAIVYYRHDAHYRMVASIDLAATRWSVAVIPRFSGTFNGNGYTISHLTITGVDYLGLFGRLQSGGAVKDLGVVDVNIVGSGNNIGGLIGSNGGSNDYKPMSSTVIHCFSNGKIIGEDNVGGLVGHNRGTVIDCYSSGTISGTFDVGGLVGLHIGDVVNCYSTGETRGGWGVGGLVGNNFAWGIGNVITSFWDVETSGLENSYGGIGKTTTEMQTASTFLEAGWDFVGETANGIEDVWWINEVNDYPRLWWEPLKYGGGMGEPNDPYLIYTAEHLNTIGTEPNDWDKRFKLMADIDLADFLYDAALIAPDGDPCDPAFVGTSFMGVFDGNSHTISNLTILGEGYLGLIGRTESGAVVENLGLIDANIAGADYVGGLVGFSKGNLVNCYTTGIISGDKRVGGLTGRNWGTIAASYNAASVTGNDDVGGLAAANYGDIANSYNIGPVTANRDVGGLVGENYGSIAFSYSTGAVSGATRAGGLVGYNWPDTGVVSGFWDVETSGLSVSDGGIGKTTAEMQVASTFLDAGWDFTGEITNGTEEVWWILEGQDYPRLWWEAK